MPYAEERAAQLENLDAFMRAHPPTPDTSDAPDPDDPAETWTSVGSWPPPPMGARS